MTTLDYVWRFVIVSAAVIGYCIGAAIAWLVWG